MTSREFDPELYLRLLGERALAKGEDLSNHHGQAALPEAVAALSVNGVISPELAAEINSDYSFASMVSQESPMLAHQRRNRPTTPVAAVNPEPVAAQRTYALDARLRVLGGWLRVGVLSADSEGGRFQAAFVSDTKLDHTSGGPPALAVTLPSGHSSQTSFRGGWGDYQAEGHFSFRADLGAPLPWLEIAGHRLELPAPAPPTPVQIETFSSEGRAMRYLWQLVGDFNTRQNHSGLANRAASEALVRAGLIAPDHPELQAVLWVADARAGQGHRMLRRHRRGPGPPAAADIPAGVPANWQSVLASPVTGPGPEGTLALAAATPVFDHLSVAVNALRSELNSATLEVTATSTLFNSRRGPVVFWAEDDRGNHYLGETGSWGGGGADTTNGEIAFGSLHPKARSLTLAVTSLDARALIPVTLDWPAREPTP
jgi:hypothetical protein